MTAAQSPHRVEDLITAHDVADLVGRPKHMLWYWLKYPERFRFPRPVRTFRQFSVFDVNEVRQWVMDHPSLCNGSDT